MLDQNTWADSICTEGVLILEKHNWAAQVTLNTLFSESQHGPSTKDAKLQAASRWS
jgi:hypothetical protein